MEQRKEINYAENCTGRYYKGGYRRDCQCGKYKSLLLAECRTLGGCKTGQAKLTKGYRLPAKYIIHTPGPVWNGGNNREEEQLHSCYENCLRLALEHGCSRVAFPSISTGIYRFPLEKASVIAVNTILTFCKEHPELQEVQMVCFDDYTKKCYEKALDEAVKISESC